MTKDSIAPKVDKEVTLKHAMTSVEVPEKNPRDSKAVGLGQTKATNVMETAQDTPSKPEKPVATVPKSNKPPAAKQASVPWDEIIRRRSFTPSGYTVPHLDADKDFFISTNHPGFIDGEEDGKVEVICKNYGKDTTLPYKKSGLDDMELHWSKHEESCRALTLASSEGAVMPRGDSMSLAPRAEPRALPQRPTKEYSVAKCRGVETAHMQEELKD